MFKKVGISLGAALLLAGCASPAASSGGKVSVVAGFYPLAYAAAQVGGGQVEITTLASPGVEPHDLELTPAQVVQIREADLVLYIPGLQPAVDEAIADADPSHVLDVTTGLTVLPAPGSIQTGGTATDPHVWLDPQNMSVIGQSVESRLATIDVGDGEGFASRQAVFAAKLGALDSAWKAGTTTCASRDLVVSHEAFGYLANRYGFTQIGLSGISPDAEPDPATLAKVADYVTTHSVRTIYSEALVDPKVATVLAQETGARTAVLDPIEGIPVGSNATYLTLMEANLAAVKDGQPCP